MVVLRGRVLSAAVTYIIVSQLSLIKSEEGASSLASTTATTGGNVELVPNNPFEIRVDKELNSKTVRLGQKLVLDCEISGTPTPAYTWYKDGNMLEPIAGRFIFTDMGWGHRLRVSKTIASDAGLYTCEAKNLAGTRNTSATITITAAMTTRRPRIQPVTPNREDDSDLRAPSCQEYKGDYCKFLSSKDIYVTSRRDQHNAEKYVLGLVEDLTNMNVNVDTRCFQKSVEAACYEQLPICAEQQVGPPLPRRLCKQECMALFELCKTHFPADLSGWSKLPDCSPLDNNAECVRIGLTVGPQTDGGADNQKGTVDRNSEDSASTSDMIVQIVLPAVLAVLLVVAIIIVAICICRRRSKLPGRNSATSSNSSQAKSVELSSLSDRTAHVYIKDISLDNINMLQELGESSYGKVYHGQVFGLYGNNTAAAVFIKCLQEKATHEQNAEFREEITNMSELRHQHVLSLLAISTKGITQCLLYEHLQLGDLRQFLLSQQSRGNCLTVKELMYIVTQVASALEYLSSLNYVHKDVAAHNVIVSHNLNVKLSKLNIIHGVHSANYCMIHNKMLPIRWLPSECITYNKFSAETDIYAYGVLLWESFSGAQQPYVGFTNQEVIEMVRSRQLLACPNQCPPRIYSLMVECWHETPNKRPTAKEVHQKLRAWYLDNSYAISTTTGPSISASGSTCTAPSHHSSSGVPPSYPVSNQTNLTDLQGSKNCVDEGMVRPGYSKEDTAPYYSTIDTSFEPNGGRHTPSSSSFDNASEYTDSTNPPLINSKMPPNYYASTPTHRYASLGRRHDNEFGTQTTPLFSQTDQV